MKRILLAASLTAAMATVGPAHATGVPVFDASNLAQLITQATTLAEQLTALQQHSSVITSLSDRRTKLPVADA